MAGHGKKSLLEAIELYLGSVLDRADAHPFEPGPLLAEVPNVVAWITWARLGEIVDAQRACFVSSSASIEGSVGRLVDSVVVAIARHT